MELSKYIACICEGAAEEAIMNVLLENDKLIFTSDNLLEGEIIRCRSAKSSQQRYLRKGFTEGITILRILDSRREIFKLDKTYINKVKVINIITAPEIEMLVIFNEGKYNQYKKSKKKPSDFCIEDLGYRSVKSKSFINDYFSNVDKLIEAIKEYRRVSNLEKGEFCLLDLLK